MGQARIYSQRCPQQHRLFFYYEEFQAYVKVETSTMKTHISITQSQHFIAVFASTNTFPLRKYLLTYFKAIPRYRVILPLPTSMYISEKYGHFLT